MSERTRVFLVDPWDLIRCQNSDTTTQETTPSPFHPLATYDLTRQTQQFSVKEMEKKEVVNKRKVSFLLRFNLLLFIIIG